MIRITMRHFWIVLLGTVVLGAGVWDSVLPVTGDSVFPVYTLEQTIEIGPYDAWGMTFDAGKNLYVATQTNDMIAVFDPSGNSIENFTGFNQAVDVVVDGGRLYITDWGTNNLSVIENGSLVDSTPITGPRGIEWGPDGKLYVAAQGEGQVKVYSPSLLLLDTIDGFSSPIDVAFTPDGRLLVSDVVTDNITVFSPDLVKIGSFGSPGSGLGQFATAYGITVNIDGYIFVADWSRGRVQIFDPLFQVVGVISGVNQPAKVLTDGNGGLYISDFYYGNVTIWRTSDLGDHNGPNIMDIQISPSNPVGGQPVEVTAVIIDVSGVAVVNLSYVASGGTESTVVMTGNQDVYNATLLGLPANSLITINITAVDASYARHTTSVTHQFNVLAPVFPLPVDAGILGISGVVLGALALAVALTARRGAPRGRRKK